MKKNIWKYGAISGFISSVWMVVAMISFDCATMQGSELIGYSIMILSFSMIFVGVKNYRDKQNEGVISFGKAFKLGLLITLVGGSIYVLVWSVDYNFFVPDFMENYTKMAIEKAKASGQSKDMVDAQVSKLETVKELYHNPLFFILITYSEILPVGILISLITALILKRKTKPSETTGSV